VASSDATRKHPDEAALLKFLARPDQGADYVRRTAQWLKDNYPGSVASMTPRLRTIYREKTVS
jgi:hypothetical protein